MPGGDADGYRGGRGPGKTGEVLANVHEKRRPVRERRRLRGGAEAQTLGERQGIRYDRLGGQRNLRSGGWSERTQEDVLNRWYGVCTRQTSRFMGSPRWDCRNESGACCVLDRIPLTVLKRRECRRRKCRSEVQLGERGVDFPEALKGLRCRL